jgi:hypothetical protein
MASMGALHRYFLRFCLSAALIVASMIWAVDSRAQDPNARKPDNAPPPNTGNTPLPAGDLKSILARAPKDIIIVNPCKGANAPSYCNAKD